MKKLTSIIFNCIIILSSLGVAAIQNDFRTLEENDIFHCPEPEIHNGNFYSTITLNEATTYMKNPGQPMLPVITKTYTYPIGTIISEVICEPINVEEINIDKEIIYAIKPIPRSSDIISSYKTIKDISVYSSVELYPDEWYDYNIRVGLKDNKHVTFLTIQFYPVRYSPLNNIIKYATDVDFCIKYKTQSNPISFSDENDLVIISPIIFKNRVKKLVAHKENMGLNTKLVTTWDIYLNYEGRDNPEKIKNFIKYAVEEWGTKYVLLFGGMKGQRFWSWYVPVRYSHLDDASVVETKYVSDLYYADIYKYDESDGYTFDDWDSNGNGVFAEWNKNNKDVLDMDPDVYVGRLPCRYKFEVNRVIDKIINYEKDKCDKEWFNKIALVAGDSFDDISWNTSTDYIEGQLETEVAIDYMEGFEPTRLWVEGGDIELTTSNAEKELSKGHGFVLFTGHGNPISWATHPHGNFNKWINFDIISITRLDNDNKLPIVIVGGCHNCQFDISVFRRFNIIKRIYGEANPFCWGWLYTSQKDSGSIVTIGNTGFGYGTIGDAPDPPDEIPGSQPDGIPDCIQYLGGWIEPHFFKVYNHDGKDIVGEAHGQTQSDYLSQFPIDWELDWINHNQSSTLVDCKTVQQWVLFGDPSLKIGGY